MKSFEVKKKEEKTLGHHYSPNTKEFVFEIARMAQSLVEKFKDSEFKPVIMIDGPAGTGKSTFTRDLVARLKELSINLCVFEQDNFGVFRDIRANNKINPCSDLARDPQTVAKLKDLMEGSETRIPSYDTSTGVRVKDAKPLASGDLIVYEGVSSLSAVIYQNSQFDDAHRMAVPIKIFLRTDNEATLHQSRLKRDVEERSVTPLSFSDSWNDSRRNNWIYTMRGIVNSNFIVTRTKNNEFLITYLRPVTFYQDSERQEVRSLYQPLSPDIRRSEVLKLQKERHDILMSNMSRWFSTYHDALRCAFEFQKQLQKQLKGQEISIDQKALIKLRDELANYHILDNGTPESKTSRRSSSEDDNSVPSKQTVTKYHGAFYRVQQGKSRAAMDDMALIQNKKHGKLFQQSLAHDEKFNSKSRIGLENALAAIVIDNLALVKEPIKKVTHHLLDFCLPLIKKNLAGTASQEEKEIIKFMLAPFLPNAPDMELGRMIPGAEEKISDKGIQEWFLKTLQSDVTPETLFTHIRFQIRFAHLISEQGAVGVKEAPPLVSEVFMSKDEVEKTKNLYKSLKTPFSFDAAKQRGRMVSQKKQRENLTTTFGTYVDIHDLPPEFRKFIGLRSLPLHSAGKQYITAIPTTEHNIRSFDHDHPLSSSGSGAVALLMCAAEISGLGGEDLMKYHLACIVNMIAGGHHTITECLAASQFYEKLTLKDGTLTSLIPESLRDNSVFAELLRLSRRPEFSSLWEDVRKPTFDNRKKL